MSGANLHENDLAILKGTLLNRKKEILDQSATLQGRWRGDAYSKQGDDADRANLELGLDLDFKLFERDRLMLQKIERALEKLSKGEYGLCEGCGADMSFKRLKVSPTATLCIGCQEEQEELRRNFAYA